MKNNLPLIVGIDPGTTVGVAVWDIEQRKIIELFEIDMFVAHEYLLDLKTRHDLFVVLEDARMMVTKRRADSASRLQGAGSIKRDAVLWVTWLQGEKIPFIQRAPGKTLKGRDGRDTFREFTGIETKIGQDHMRDAAMMVVDTTARHYALMLQKSQTEIKPRKKQQSWRKALELGKIKTVKP